MPKRPRSASDRPSPHAPALEAASLALRRGQADTAQRLAEDVLRADRSNLAAARTLGAALMMQDQPEAAIDALQRAARRCQDAGLETQLAHAFTAAGRGDEALAQLRLATTRRPAFPPAFLELGDRLGALGRLDEGIAVFEQGLALAPDAVVLGLGLGYLHLRRNERAEARRLFEAVRAAAPERRDAMIALARAHALDGEHAAACELYRQALDLRPDDITSRIELGKCQLEMGERAAGEATLRLATGGVADRAGPAILALAGAAHGRVFLRPSAAAGFLRVAPD